MHCYQALANSTDFGLSPTVVLPSPEGALLPGTAGPFLCC